MSDIRKALERIKAHVVGDARPRWDVSMETTASRGYIADLCDAALAQPQAAQAGEVAWLIEWKDGGQGPQWWGFSHSPGVRANWCHDPNKAIRFSRREDAERMRKHVIAVAGLTGHAAYERCVNATEHMWLATPPTEPAPQEKP